MTATKAGALIDRKSQWAAIDWPKARREVRRLQVRIAKAVTERRWNKVKTLQHLLTHSYYAKVLAVKRVTSNKGRKTPGVDGIIWRNLSHSQGNTTGRDNQSRTGKHDSRRTGTRNSCGGTTPEQSQFCSLRGRLHHYRQVKTPAGKAGHAGSRSVPCTTGTCTVKG